MASLIKNLATVLAISGSTASAHMILANPVPYSKDTITNSPLSSSGSNYPCQISGDASTFYSTSGISNKVTAGESLTMSFTGSAVHEGGSCQVALSTDMEPSQTTRWSVILSIEGGCPSKDGTSASTYDVTIPSDIPAGTYSYAWTWTSKLSGTQEYYMNCAPITVEAASSTKRDLRSRDDVMDNYPPLAVYNLADLNSCKSTLSSDPTYPYPGDTVDHDCTGSNKYTPVAITGSDCFATGVTWSNTSSSSSSSSSSSDSSSSASSSESSSTAASSATEAASSATEAASSATSAASVTGGGVFATSASSSAAASVTSVDSGSSGASTTGSGSGSGASETTTASTSTSTGSASTSGSCTAGDYDCASDGSSYKMCVAGGTWSVSMSMAAGTACTPGTSSGLTISATSRKKWRFVRS